MEPKLARRTANQDGGTAETYGGILTVAGVRYSFEVLPLADLDGVWRFVPVEWSAAMRAA